MADVFDHLEAFRKSEHIGRLICRKTANINLEALPHLLEHGPRERKATQELLKLEVAQLADPLIVYLRENGVELPNVLIVLLQVLVHERVDDRLEVRVYPCEGTVQG